MRQHFIYLFIFLLGTGASAQVGINNPTPDASAALDVTSTTKGLLPPRMTKSQRDAIVSPAIGLIVFCTDCGLYGEAQIYSTSWRNMIGCTASIPITNVTNPTTGEIWMDRNLGASQVATSSTDAAAYGELYQWGRAKEGHQVRTSGGTSGTTSTNATTAVPNGGNPWDALFIPEDFFPSDWLIPQDVTLWQGVNGTNNPCPLGYRLPTEAEWEAERTSWTTNNAAGAFLSPLKLPTAGFRRNESPGSLVNVGIAGDYWSSTVSGTRARYLYFFNSASNSATMATFDRANGLSVRCLKD